MFSALYQELGLGQLKLVILEDEPKTSAHKQCKQCKSVVPITRGCYTSGGFFCSDECIANWATRDVPEEG